MSSLWYIQPHSVDLVPNSGELVTFIAGHGRNGLEQDQGDQEKTDISMSSLWYIQPHSVDLVPNSGDLLTD